MYRARDQVEEAEWLEELETAAATLNLDSETQSMAADLYLSAVPESDSTKPTDVAASLYAAALISGDERTQTAVAEAVGVSRLVIQDNWKEILATAGFQPPTW